MDVGIKFPVVGHKVVIENVPQAASELRITYQPDAPIADVATIEIHTEDRVTKPVSKEWTPAKPGIAKVEAVAADGTVVGSFERSIKFDGSPGSGVGIFVLAAVVLFGGSAMSLRLLLRHD
jgi:hypothetical protein